MRLLVVSVSLLVGACAAAPTVAARAPLPVASPAPPAREPEEVVLPAADAPVFAGDALVPCRDKDDLDHASTALDAVYARIWALGDGAGADVDVVKAELHQLMTTPCFELANADFGSALDFDSGIALSTWFTEGGGLAALQAYLLPPMLNVTIPEAPRPSFFLDGNEKHPLAPLLCRASDKACGHATAGWSRRAMRTFVDAAEAARSDEKNTCDEEAARAEPTERWRVLRGCQEGRIGLRSTLPLGRFKAPTDGLFAMVEGSNCRNLRIYDLASGLSVRLSTCRTVKGVPHVQIGRVPLASLREAAWMTMLAEIARADFRPQDTFNVPADVVVGRPRGSGTASDIGLGRIGYSSRRVFWSWLRPSKSAGYVGQVSGDDRGGPSWKAADDARELFAIADDGFDETCAPPIPSAFLAWNGTGPSLRDLDLDVAAAFEHPDIASAKMAVLRAKRPPTCTNAL